MKNIDESKKMIETQRLSIGTVSARSAVGRKARVLDTALLSLNAMDCISVANATDKHKAMHSTARCNGKTAYIQ